MTRRAGMSAQTLAVLVALAARPSDWQHGYALAHQTQLKSGTLYPILIRLADRGLVEARWQDEPLPGRPRRHLYRLTAGGGAAVVAALADIDATAATATTSSGSKRAPTRTRRSIAVPGASASVADVDATAVPCAG